MKLLLAFAAGVALASLSFVLLNVTATNSPTEQSNATTPISSLGTDSVGVASPIRQASAPAEAATADRSSERVSGGIGFPDELIRFALSNERLSDDPFALSNRSEEERDLMSGWSDEELNSMAERARGTVRSQEVLDAQRVLQLLERELGRRQQIAEWANSPPVDPIYLPPEFDSILENSVLRGNHEDLQREPVDPSWSNAMETNFQSFFDSRPEVADTYGAPTITCRVSGCEITILAYGIDAAALAIEHELTDSAPAETVSYDFGVAIRGWRDQPWAGEFLTVLPPGIRVENGATTIFWPLRR